MYHRGQLRDHNNDQRISMDRAHQMTLYIEVNSGHQCTLNSELRTEGGTQ